MILLGVRSANRLSWGGPLHLIVFTTKTRLRCMLTVFTLKMHGAFVMIRLMTLNANRLLVDVLLLRLLLRQVRKNRKNILLGDRMTLLSLGNLILLTLRFVIVGTSTRLYGRRRLRKLVWLLYSGILHWLTIVGTCE